MIHIHSLLIWHLMGPFSPLFMMMCKMECYIDSVVYLHHVQCVIVMSEFGKDSLLLAKESSQ